jgi:metal-responsive CopG/Arc/MetJ family transcriptional regulator
MKFKAPEKLTRQVESVSFSMPRRMVVELNNWLTEHDTINRSEFIRRAVMAEMGREIRRWRDRKRDMEPGQ